MKVWPVALVAVFLQFGATTSSFAVDGVNSVDQLLRKLSHTLQEKNYRGLFTYEYGGTMDTLEIIHVVENGIEYEQLQHLNGPSREFVRSGRPVDCVNPAAQLLRGGLFSLDKHSIQLHQYYDLNVGGSERVAGRAGTVVQLVPKDQYRYGLTLSIDKASGFPMKTLVISNKHKVLERIQFVELDFDVTPDIMRLKTGGNDHMNLPAKHESCRDVDPSGDNLVANGPVVPVDTTEWRAEWLPLGFILAEHSYSAADGHQLTYTDGLASFSIFVTSVEREGPAQPSLAQRGATVVLMFARPLQDNVVNITVVGEVPPVTAEKVALGLRLVSQGSP